MLAQKYHKEIILEGLYDLLEFYTEQARCITQEMFDKTDDLELAATEDALLLKCESIQVVIAVQEGTGDGL